MDITLIIKTIFAHVNNIINYFDIESNTHAANITGKCISFSPVSAMARKSLYDINHTGINNA